MNRYILFLMSVCVLSGCYVSSESIQTEEITQEMHDQLYEIGKSRAKPLPPAFPRALWPDIEHSMRISFERDGEITVTSWTKHTVKRVHSILEGHFLELGWAVAPPDEDILQYMAKVGEEDWGVEEGRWRYTKDDERITLWFYSSSGNEASFDIPYSDEAMRQGYVNALDAKMNAFGESEAAAEALMESIMATYATCDSYRDSGDLHSCPDKASRHTFDWTKFTLAFERDSNRFRFEALDLGSHVTRDIMY